MLSTLFHVVLYKPIFNVFVGLYNVIPGQNVGVVILLTTIVVRAIVFPLTYRYIQAQRAMMALNPKLEALRKEYANDKQKQAQATMELYKEHKINPLASCLPLLLQLPIIIALYQVMSAGIVSSDVGANLYSFVANPGTINVRLFGVVDLSKPVLILAVLAGLAQFVQAKLMLQKPAPKDAGASGKDEDMAAMMNKQMMYLMPAMTVFIGMKLPSGLALYWLLSTVLMIAERYLVDRFSKKELPPSVADVEKVIEGTVLEKIVTPVDD